VFTSANGGLSTAEGAPTSNLPLRAGKGFVYGGHSGAAHRALAGRGAAWHDEATCPSPRLPLRRQAGCAGVPTWPTSSDLTTGIRTAECHSADRVAARLDRRQILESLLEPAKVIAPEYRTWLAVTEDGRSVTGLVAQRTDDTVSIVDAKGKRTDLAAAAIEELEPLPTSLMPEHLLRDLTAGQAADLLTYLQSLR